MTGTQVEPIRLEEDFFSDPQRQYAILRRERPVVPVVAPSGWSYWLVTRYEDVRTALASPKLHKNGREYEAMIGQQDAGFDPVLDQQMLSADPPDHTRLRKLVNKAFTGRAIAALRPRIEEITAGLLDAMEAGPDRVDLLDAFAFPLPITVICELLGIPFEDRDDFRHWSNTLLQQGTEAAHQEAAHSMATYLGNLVNAKFAEPRDDMLSAIVQATEDSDRLSQQEAVGMAFLLLVAGHETTVNLIGNGTLALLNHPDQLAELKADPDLVPGAVEELLRYNGPINLATFRFTTEATTIGGVEIPAAQPVLVSLVSANRDADRYADADDLNVRREASHLAFGHGIHYCLGAPLARLEGQIAFTRLLARFPGLALDADPASLTWRPSTLIHGLEHLPVKLR
jgi:cytochrome P450